MTDKEVINYHLTNSYIESSSGTFFSGFCGALKDARKMTGRNIYTGAKDGTNHFGHLGSWLGTIGYLSLLDQIGGCFRRLSGPEVEENKSGIVKALKHFSNLDDNQIDAIYALRNSFAHDFSLQNVGRRPGLIHHFEVGNSSIEPLIVLPNDYWDGDLESKSKDNLTKINLQALGDEVEKLVKNLIQLNSESKVEIILENGKDELLKRYSFATGNKVI
ncbi:hypothetical protein [Owenweeksia hongkongensis]|uniref:hypothetical protein n=1 Tax=Owenweeksia hongkongensis TaxID=253245 RepID=UPI003A9574A6